MRLALIYLSILYNFHCWLECDLSCSACTMAGGELCDVGACATNDQRSYVTQTCHRKSVTLSIGEKYMGYA